MKKLYDVTFTFDPADTDKEVKSVHLQGEFLFYRSNLTGNTDETGMVENDPKYPPAQYEDGMDPIGGIYLQEMDKNEEGLYETTLKLPAGSYVYNFVLNADLVDPDPASPFAGFMAMMLPDGTKKMFSNADEIMEVRRSGKAYAADINVTIPDPKKPSGIPTVTGSIPGTVLLVGTPEESRRIPNENPAKRGTVTYMSYTDVFGNVQSLCVYLPAGFDRTKTYPLVLVSHGGGGNEAEWAAQGNIDNIMDNLIAEGKTREAILVMMNNSVYSWDFANIAKNCEEAILPFIEKILPVSKDPEERAFCGLSMGSMTTLYMYYHRTEVYGYYGAFSGGVAPGNPYFTLENPHLKDVKLLIGSAEEDIAYNQRDIGVPTTIRALKEAGIPYTPYFVPGSHDWFCWPAMYEYFAEHILWK
ncbi:MAG: hypothetical protein IJL98_04735 [Lachnospiraceae bacterium]|nr:hypothetical protein [Lachnospiraceae bacterium]